MANETQTTGLSDFKDRKGGLVAFGVIQILFGACFLLMIPFMAFSLSMAASHPTGSAMPMGARMIVPIILFYALLATGFIWMGIGSIQARRWARALVLVTSWFWLISGIIGVFFMLVCMPDMYAQMGKTNGMPRTIMNVVKYVTLGCMVFFYVVIPGLFVLFYGSRHTKATCERRDPHVRWTDKCPLPVLGVSLIAGCWAAGMPLVGIYDWAIPFFGFILTGLGGAGVALVVAFLFGYVARGLYRLSMTAWWGAVAMVIAWGVSCGITFSRVSFVDYYAKMNLPAEQLEMLKQMPFFSGPWMVLFCELWVVGAVVYLLYIRKYLSQQKGVAPAADAVQIPEPVPPLLPLVPQAGTPSGGLAIASCVLGILATMLGIFIIGGVFGILGLILGIIQLTRKRTHRALAGWGIGLSVVGILLTAAILLLVLWGLKSRPHLTREQRQAQTAKALSDPTTPEIERFYALNGAAKEAYNTGNREQARAYAEEQAGMLERYKGDWNYGNAVQDVNLVLGRIAAADGDLERAKTHLLKAGDSPGSPQMNSFGPNMSLAKDLLEKGEQQAVLEYFKKCAVFWKMDRGRLEAWASEVKSGRIPDFGPNLLY
jgi:hypothetical protein